VSFYPSSYITFDEYNSGPISVEVTISDDYMTGVLGTNSSSAYIEIMAEISGTTSYDFSSLYITEDTSP
jgi:hypothetical protein